MSAVGPEDRELERLLPFYVNGTLEDEERAQVEAFLGRSPAARDEVAFLARLREQVQQVGEAPSQGELGLRRALRDIRAEKRARLRTPTWMKVALAASLAVIVAQGAALLLPGEPTPVYTTAGEGGQVLELRFHETATEAQIRAALDGVGATLVDGPGPFGIYRVALPAEVTAAADVQAAVDVLARDTEVVRQVQAVER